MNYAYDCAGLRRPIIQGGAGEIVNLSSFMHYADQLNINDANDPCDDIFADGINRYIPQALITKFFNTFPQYVNQIDPDDPTHTYQEYYFDGNTPRCNLPFKADRLANVNGYMDIAKLETRMWLYYQSVTQIDMGYTAIHMGIYWLYAESDRPDYNLLHELTAAIRAYASENDTFVLLSGETPYDNVDNGQSPKWKDTDQLIFDFDQRAMRPREISPPNQVWGDGNGCSGPIDPNAAALFSSPSSPCFKEALPAVVDPCSIESAGGTVGGISPLGCHYEQVPYLVHWDGFYGPINPGQASPITPPNSPNGLVSTLTWGYNDHRWFSLLSPECRKAWFEYFYCDRNNYLGGHGYLLTPGIISITYTQPSDPAYNTEKLLMADDPTFTAMIKDLFIVDINDPNKKPEISVEEHCMDYDKCQYLCHNNPAGAQKMWKTGQKYYVIRINNKNCSSTYSIHIIDPNGNWLPQELGDEYILYPTEAGNYQIGAREDNLSFPADTYGTREVWEPHYLEDRCCIEKVQWEDCKPIFWNFNKTCLGGDNEKSVYWFEVNASDLTAVVSNVRSVSPDCQIVSLTPSTAPSNNVSGIINVYDKTNPRLDLRVAYTNNERNGDVLIRESLTPCSSYAEVPQNRSTESPIPQGTDLQLFPNPTTGEMELKFSTSPGAKVFIEIFDAAARSLFHTNLTADESLQAVHLNVGQFASGIYFVKVYTDTNEFHFAHFIKE